MAISYPLTFPVKVPNSAVLRMRSIVAKVRSPFTGQTQVQVHQGRLWETSITYPRMVRADAELIIAFLAKLDGMRGTFLMGDPAGGTPRGSAASSPGTPLVMGAGQTGSDLEFDGVPGGASSYLLPGDYIHLGSGTGTHLHKVLDQVDADSTGVATMTLWPELRESPANGATIVVSSALGHFRLTENLSEFSINEALHYGISFEAEEALELA